MKDRHVYTKDRKLIANEFDTFFSAVGEKAAREYVRLAEINNISLISLSHGTPGIHKNGQFHFAIVPSAPFNSAWKKAEVIPIYKEGDHDKLASNNRPVSLSKNL